MYEDYRQENFPPTLHVLSTKQTNKSAYIYSKAGLSLRHTDFVLNPLRDCLEFMAMR